MSRMGGPTGEKPDSGSWPDKSEREHGGSYEQPFLSVLEIAENALTVGTVATTDLWSLSPSVDVATARSMLREKRFDVAPLRDESPFRYVHVDDLTEDAPGLESVARPIDASRLVTSDLGLADGIEALRGRGFYFVLVGDRVRGVVTNAELGHPAVSMVSVSILLVAEAAMSSLVAGRHGSHWKDSLSAERLDQIRKRWQDRQKFNSETEELDCLTLEDRLRLVCKDAELRRGLGFSRDRFEDWSELLKRRRNDLAHANGLLEGDPNPDAAIDFFVRLRGFARRVCALAGASTAMPDHVDEL
jgi:hypothetical protein